MKCFRSYLTTVLKGRSIRVRVISIDKARTQLSTLIKQSAEDGIPIVVQCPKGVGAVLVDLEQWNEIQDTLYLISLRKKLKEEFSSDGNPLEEAMKELGFTERKKSNRKEKTEEKEEGQ